MNRTRLKKLSKNAVEYSKHGWTIMPLEPFTGTPVSINGMNVLIDHYKQGLHYWTMTGPGSKIGLPLQINNMVAIHFSRNKKIDGLEYARHYYNYGVNSPSIVAPGGDIYVLYGKKNIKNFNSKSQNQFLSHGIELLIDGCVLLPPSTNRSGKEYTWLTNPNNPLNDLPDWIHKLLSNPKYEIFIKWIMACCRDQAGSHVTTTDAYCCYKEWADEKDLVDYHRLNQQEFSAEMARRYRKERIYAKNGSRPNCYLGVGI